MSRIRSWKLIGVATSMEQDFETIDVTVEDGALYVERDGLVERTPCARVQVERLPDATVLSRPDLPPVVLDDTLAIYGLPTDPRVPDRWSHRAECYVAASVAYKKYASFLAPCLRHDGPQRSTRGTACAGSCGHVNNSALVIGWETRCFRRTGSLGTDVGRAVRASRLRPPKALPPIAVHRAFVVPALAPGVMAQSVATLLYAVLFMAVLFALFLSPVLVRPTPNHVILLVLMGGALAIAFAAGWCARRLTRPTSMNLGRDGDRLRIEEGPNVRWVPWEDLEVIPAMGVLHGVYKGRIVFKARRTTKLEELFTSRIAASGTD